MFCYFRKDKSSLILTLLISEYLEQILPWKEKKEAFSVKFQAEKSFFLKKKNETKAPHERNIMQSLSTFIGISGPVAEVKKVCIGKIFPY